MVTTIDRQLQSNTGTRHLLPAVSTLEKGKSITYTVLGPSAAYVIEGTRLHSMSINFNP